MKSSLLIAAVLTLSLSNAQAQTTPASNAPIDNNTNVVTPSATQPTRTNADGSSITNNRDRLSAGTGTQVPRAQTAADRQARTDAKRAKRAAKGKTK